MPMGYNKPVEKNESDSNFTNDLEEIKERNDPHNEEDFEEFNLDK